MKLQVYIIAGLMLLATISCDSNKIEEQPMHVDENQHEHAGNDKEEVHLLQKQMDVMGIELGSFQFLNLSTTVRANGQLTLPPQKEASLGAMMSGRITEIMVLEGNYVEKGQILAKLEHPQFVEMQQEYMTAISELEFSEKELKRKESLYKDSISSERTMDQSRANFGALRAQVNGLRAKLEMMNVDVKSVEKGNILRTVPVISPISGYVKSIDVNVGKFVEPNQMMFEIVDNEHIHIDLMVYEKDIDKVHKGQKVIFSLTTRPDQVFEGSIFSLGSSFERDVKAMAVHAELNNKLGKLLPGMYVDARIVTNEEEVRSLPNDAIVSDGGLNYIFVLLPESTHSHNGENEHSDEGADKEYVFRKIEVNTGATDIGFTEVVPAYNLPEHIKIVTKGAFYLLAEMKKGEEGSGHHH